MRTIAIVPSAGSGKRLGIKTKKPFVLLGGEPILARTLKAINGCGAVDAILIAVEKSCVKKTEGLVRKFGIAKVAGIVVGGKTRYESVRNCLGKVDDSYGIVLIHDGARPLVDNALLEGSIRIAGRYGSCIAAVPENDTVKLVDGNLFIRKTLDRTKVFRAQTPQVFRRGLIQKAYAIKGNSRVTDDSGLVEAIGKKVKILEGTYRNIKITTKEDLEFAQAVLGGIRR